MTLDAHDTHCCIDHGCKYGNENCPIANGTRKQQCFCERCGLETEGYYGPPERTHDEQQEHLDALWKKYKQRPKNLSPDEKIAELAKRYGCARLIAMLKDVKETGMDYDTLISCLKKEL